MAEIVLAGDPVLRTPAAPVPDELFGTDRLRALVDEMVATMRAAPGVGLAAPQIGVGLRVIVLEDRAEYATYLTEEQKQERGRVDLPLAAIVNPTLRLVEGAPATYYEGCLSVPGYAALVARAAQVEVEGFTPEGKPVSMRVAGWPARILQHECDHLDGTLYIDRMITRSFATVERTRQTSPATSAR